MPSVDSMMYHVGYCTNVHAGATWQQTQENLEKYAARVRQIARPDSALGVGLWLSARAAAELTEAGGVEAFGQWLRHRRLVPYTMNGFPYGDFHEARVKHKVYQPTWRQQARLDYTLQVADILAKLLESGEEGSISTLPLQWGVPDPTPEELAAAAENLAQLAERLEQLHEQTDRLIYVCLEPEPGCVIQRSADVLRFFDEYLLPGRNRQRILRHVRVCHDICHAAVMFEDQQDVLGRYHDAEIRVGKMQISSAIVVPMASLELPQRYEALEQLKRFAEDRYLHQTTVAWPDGRKVFWQDLPELLAEPADELVQSEQWCIHFHVPVYLESFHRLTTSQSDIARALDAARKLQPELKHLEVETYAWSVLPEELQTPDLAEGIAEEIQWFDRVLADRKG